MKRALFTMTVIICLATVVAGCDVGRDEAVDGPSSPGASSTASTPASAQDVGGTMVCDPHSGFPAATNECPDPDPETGWLTASSEQLTLKPFRTLGNDAEGKAYASEHGEDFPFPNDYFDAPDGPSHPVQLAPETACTGIILVGYQEPLEDHVVSCADLVEAATGRRVPVAIWSTDGTTVQVSELYRP